MAGAKPSFSEVHVIRTIIALQARTGRKKLLRKIGIGEGSMRTILKKLKNNGLIDSAKKGHALNDSGNGYLNEYMKKFSAPFKIHADDIVGGRKTGIVVHAASGKITTGLSERDMAVRTGASGAIVLKYDNKAKKLTFPDEVRQVEDFLMKSGRLKISPALKTRLSRLIFISIQGMCLWLRSAMIILFRRMPLLRLHFALLIENKGIVRKQILNF